MSEPIAIVGMACEYPGARTPAELWENVLAGRQAFRRIPPGRLRLADYHSPDRAAADAIYSTEAAVLEGWEFDRVAFKVSGASYRSADLAHWLALDVAARALADAGAHAGEGLERATTGVLVGNSLTGEFSRAGLLRLRWPYVRRVVGTALAAEGWEEERLAAFLAGLERTYKEPFAPVTEETLAGGLSNTIAGRIANHFDLGGGAYTVDGACASSLLAVAHASTALAAGDLDAALAGGVDLSLDPFELVGFAKAGALAPEEMRVYDRRSAGFIPGEGCGFVVLMREADALAQGRRVYAVVRGWGISSDGAGGITRPEAEGQLLAIRRAYRRAGFGIDSVGYFEGHGTGTAVGDAVELEALSAARREAGAAAPAPRPAPIGSIKAVIGHTKAAAGVAALIKATLAVHRQVLPPTTGCLEPHEMLRGESPALRPLERAEVWPADRPLRAGVSAMGFGGINTHVVVEGTARRRRRALEARELVAAFSWQDAELFALAGGDAADLLRQVERLAAVAPGLARAELADLAAELARGAGSGRLRAALVAGTPGELASALEVLRGWLAGLDGMPAAPRLDAASGVFLGAPARPPRIGLLFPGQGSPAPAGGGAFARRFPEVARLYERSAAEGAFAGAGTAAAQPAIAAASLAGLEALERLGIGARIAVGHSLGELVALCWSGALSPEALLRVASARGRAMADLAGPPGAMASLAAPAAVAAELVAGTGALLTGYNSPRQTVVAGEVAAIEAVERRAGERGVRAARLPVAHAFHSPLVAPAVPALTAALAAEEIAPPARPVVSTVTGHKLAAGEDLRALLVRQVLAPVRFAEAIEAARGEVDLWLEVGPGQVLARLLDDLAAAPALALDAGGPSLRGLLAAAGAAWAMGGALDLAALFADRLTRPFDLGREPRFLVNPCELAPQAGAVTPAVPPRPAAPAPFPAGPEPAADGEPAVEVVRRLVAARAELPAAAVTAGSRLLGDLHLNSISVGQVVVEAARSLGLRPPASPTDFATATVGEVAQALAEAARAEERSSGGGATGGEEGPPAGVDSWVRAFTVDLVERAAPAPRPAAGGGAWRIVAPPEHPLAGRLVPALAAAGGEGVVLCLPPAPDERSIPLLLEAARAALAGGAPGCFVVVQEGGGGGGFARTLHLEAPGVATAVVDLPFDHPDAAAWVAAEAAGAAARAGYDEAHYDAAGCRRGPVLRLLDFVEPPAGAAAPALGPGDVLLATGGGKGIAAECALALAQASGARLAVVGRSLPAADRGLAGNLERLAALGIEARYYAADVCDAAAVAAAVRAAEAELGPVTALLHGAGTNTPRLLAALDEAAFAATVAPKVGGLRNLLAALDPGRLKLLVTFGSIIARLGLRGEADYATANEWLALLTARFAAEHPGCRCLALEWSVWAGVGMGERLGRLQALQRQGVTPIPPGEGVAMLERLLAAPTPRIPPAVVVAGRFGAPSTLRLAPRELPLLRFLERPLVDYPGVELVTEAALSAETDPYLADHALEGERLFPAVMGMEAMAQVAMAAAGASGLPVFEDLAFHRPVVVGEGEPVVLRIAALVRAPGRVEVALRSGATGFAADHFRGVCRFDAGAAAAPDADRSPARTPSRLDVAGGDPLPLRPDPDLYDALLFHRGRFRRLSAYRALRATECLADISPDGEVSWFGRYLPQDLLLGDSAARDAALHGLQPCVPHARVLPVAVERVTAARLDPALPWVLRARERRREGDTFVYDLEIVSAGGRAVERWQGLRLRAVHPLAPPAAWQVPLLGPYVERRLQELVAGASPAVLLEDRAGADRRAASDRAIRRLTGSGSAPVRRPDGRPELPIGGRQVSIAHAGGLVFAVAGDGPVGCDVEPVVDRPPEVWRDLLGPERARLAELIAARGDGPSAAATRVWTAAECLKKAGAAHDAPLVLEGEPGGAGDWLLLRSGRFTIGTVVAAVAGRDEPLALAVLTVPTGGRG